MKRIFWFGLALLTAAVLLFSACGNKNSGAASSGTQAPSGPRLPPGTPPLPLVDKPTTLTIWHNIGSPDPTAGITTLNDVLAIQEL